MDSEENQIDLEIMTVAGGCFWGHELRFQRIVGVYDTCVGYTDGDSDFPTYQLVCTGQTNHAQAIQVQFNPKEISYQWLLQNFLDQFDPTEVNRAGPDVGTQYRSAVFYHNENQKEVAVKVIAQVQEGYQDQPVATQIKPATKFWKAEENHQKYLQKLGQKADQNCEDLIFCYG